MPREVIEGSAVGAPSSFRDVIRAQDGDTLRREIRRGLRRREIASVEPVRYLGNGWWGCAVVRLRPPSAPPRWRKPVLIAAGVIVTLGALAAAGYALLAVVADAAAGLGVAGVFGVFGVALLVAGLLRRRSGCETIITVRHRH